MRAKLFVSTVLVATGLLSGCAESVDAAAPTTGRSVSASAAARTTPVPEAEQAEVDAEEYRQAANSYGLEGYFFQTPDGEFRCALLDEPATGFSVPVQAACMGRTAATPVGQQGCTKRQTGNSPIPAAGVGASGAVFMCVGEPLFYGRSTGGVQSAKTLPANATIVGNGVSCTSATGGMTCTFNYSGDYFTISKESTELSGAEQSSSGNQAIPNVVGYRPAVAWEKLDAAGFRIEIVGGSDRGAGGGQCVVASQEPAAGTTASAGSVITLRTQETGASSAELC